MKRHSVPSMTLTSSGDSLMVKRLPENYEELAPLHDFITSAEARLTNLEGVVTRFDCFPSSYSGGTWVNATPDVFESMMTFGFNFCGCANNHSMDYSYDGLLSTMNILEEYGVDYSGIGRNLYEASRPGILDLPNARLAVVDVSASFNDAARAGAQSPSLPGRPGLNALRHSEEYTVTPAHMQALREIAAATCINGTRPLDQKAGFIAPDAEGTFYFGGKVFREGEKDEKHTRCHRGDLERITKEVRDSLNNADYAVVMVHCHDVRHDRHDEPDEYFIEFCHAVIDAGASAVLGGGTHQLKPIELYRGKPIFYSLGNFIFQNNSVKIMPPDFAEKYGLPHSAAAADALNARSKNGTVGLHTDRANYLSVIPRLTFEGDRLTDATLMPVELGYGLRMTYNGLPRQADEETAREICGICQKLGEAYGTKFAYADGLIRIIL